MTKYTQAPMPIPPNNVAYLKALKDARSLQADRLACLEYLGLALLVGQITVIDARTIWRGLYSIWRTPFD